MKLRNGQRGFLCSIEMYCHIFEWEAPPLYFFPIKLSPFSLPRFSLQQESSFSCVALSSIIKILTNLATSLKEMHTKESLLSCEGTLLEGVLFVLFLKDLCMSNLLLFTFIFNLLWRSKLNGRFLLSIMDSLLCASPLLWWRNITKAFRSFMFSFGSLKLF